MEPGEVVRGLTRAVAVTKQWTVGSHPVGGNRPAKITQQSEIQSYPKPANTIRKHVNLTPVKPLLLALVHTKPMPTLDIIHACNAEESLTGRRHSGVSLLPR